MKKIFGAVFGNHSKSSGTVGKKLATNDFDSFYFVGKVIGTGGFATVKQVTRKSDGKKFAAKIVDVAKLAGKEEMMLSEIEILKQVKHQYIISLEDLYKTPTHYYLVMDLATGGELFDQILLKGSFFEKDAARVVHQVLEALAYLHEKNIVHRDLKPENLLFRDPSAEADILVTDFGLSRSIRTNDFLMTACGTPHYIAPEILKESGHGLNVDMWSLGVITYVLLCGYTPFWGGEQDSKQVLYESIVKGQYDFDSEYWEPISNEAKDFIRKVLVVDPQKRLVSKDALSHPWFKTEATVDVLPNVRKNFNAKKTFKKAVLAVTAMNQAKSLISPPSNPPLDGESSNQ